MSAGTTWAGSHTYLARAVLSPRSVQEVQELVRAEPRLRALGTRHSFSDLADSPGVLMSLGSLGSLGSAAGGSAVALDHEPVAGPELRGDRVRVPAAMRYGDLAIWLQERGRALANLASLPHISVAGAVATGTHGSGVGNGSLATAVAAVELVDGRGELVRLERGSDPDFAGAVVGLGALGIVVAVELDTEASYDVTQTVHEGLTWAALLADPWPVLGAAYSVSVFTRWTGDLVGQVWTKARTGEVTVPGARPAPEQRHMIPGMDPSLTTPQLGVPGPWHERLPHFKLGFLPSSGEELQTEYLLPRGAAVPALEAMRGLAAEIERLLHVTELRTIAADGLWLSGAYGDGPNHASGADPGDEARLAIHFTWRKEPAAVAALLPRIEERLLPLGARPHWGKLFAAGAGDLAPLYPRWADFAGLVDRYDPDARFVNEWSARVLGR